ncbi:hypothetical protein [Streptomyces sp. SID161]|uniref:hypothetical protein n=1 Tax=Streptomyces sp. SID161 TaxID=2690251 RepID=UPI00136D8566|nr:hypothetical protein [Streptomyces sp. SID161]MYW46375.1 hypothetical protein [Streptomyces sp. SID161]
MNLVRLFHSVDTTISHLPTPLAHAAAGLLFTLFVVAYTTLATVDRTRHHNHQENP